MKFGEQIKERRQELDLTQAEVAEKLFVTRQAVSNWEHNKTYPDLNMLVRISNVYQISRDSLLRCQHRFKIVRNHRFKNVLFHRFKCCFACCSV